MKRKILAVTLVALVFLLSALGRTKPAPAEETFPSKPIRLVIGGTRAYDTLGRKFAAISNGQLGVRILPMNLSGPKVSYMYEAMRKAKPDGYTISFHHTGSMREHVLRPDLLGWDVNTLPVVLGLATPPYTIYASPKSRIKTANDLLNTKKPVRAAIWGLSIAIASLAIASEKFGFKVLPVVYPTYSEAVVGVIRGDADIMGAAASGTTLKKVASGDFVPIFLYGKERYAPLPGIPSSKELGFPPKLNTTKLHRVFLTAPGTPPDRIAKLAEILTAAITHPETVKWSKKVGQPLPIITAEQVAKESSTLTELYKPHLDGLLRDFVK